MPGLINRMQSVLEEIKVQNAFNALPVLWNDSKDIRTGKHASSFLAKDDAFCHREHVLGKYFKRLPQAFNQWQASIMIHGWSLHEQVQAMLEYARDHEEELLDFVQQELEATEGEFSCSAEEFIHLEQFVEEVEALVRKMEGNNTTSHDILLRKIGTLFQYGRSIAAEAIEVETHHYSPEYDLSFTPDALLKVDNVPYVGELKGYKHDVYLNILEQEDPMNNEEFAKARIQANLYMHLLGKPYHRSIIYIEDKSAPHRFKTWVRYYDAKLVEKPYLERLEKSMEYAELFRQTGRVPNRICTAKTDTRAQNCPLRDVCFADGKTLNTLWVNEKVKKDLLFLKRG